MVGWMHMWNCRGMDGLMGRENFIDKGIHGQIGLMNRGMCILKALMAEAVKDPDRLHMPNSLLNCMLPKELRWCLNVMACQKKMA